MAKTKKFAIPSPHPTVRTIIKQAEVDEEMVPLVDWLNGFDSVHTLYCCQGESVVAHDFAGKPYVLWTCTNTIHLIQILDKLGWLAGTEIHWSQEKRQLEYSTRFDNKEGLKSMVERISRFK